MLAILHILSIFCIWIRMKKLSTKLLLWKTDFLTAFSERKKEILLYSIILALGVSLGIYVGTKVGAKESPFGVFAFIFRSNYIPFPYILREALRFSLFAVIAILSYFLPRYPLYPAFSLFFFGKHFGELSCLVFLSDSVAAAVPTVLFTAIPLLIVGAILLIRISLSALDFRVCNGGFLCSNNLKRAGCILLCSVLIYMTVLIFVYLIFCGLFYLLISAL